MPSTIFRRKSADAFLEESRTSGLKRVLGPFDLTMLGIGAVIGTGIFVLTGEAAAGTATVSGAGPAITVSFVITAIACAFAALCYAEFASMIPVSGSAYSYAYASLGELTAWIIAWVLVLEYAIGNVAVAIGWAGYFKSFLDGLGIYLPGWMSAATGTHVIRLPDGSWTVLNDAVRQQFGSTLATMPQETAFFNLPAIAITFLITVLLVIGVKESARTNTAMVLVKFVLIALFIIFGLPHFNPGEHWKPFAPNGFSGIMSGAALVFFAYIGFDAVSTTAEEARNPQRDLPLGMIASLAICTLLYVVVAGILTGMVPLGLLANEKPVSAALTAVGQHEVSMIIAIGITFTMPTVLLVMQLGQIRIFYAMSRDGLLPQRFSKVHPKFRTPAQSTVIVGLVVGLLAGMVNIGEAAELTNIGTLFAFVLVAVGIWVLRVRQPDAPRKFRLPVYRLICSLCIVVCGALMWALPAMTWVRFLVWMAAGILIYFLYSFKNSRLNKRM